MRTSLADTIVDLAAAVGAGPDVAAFVRITAARLDLPVEIAWTSETLFVNPPRWRWQTDFDVRPGQLVVHLREMVVGHAPG
jgi:hypothetical protein